MYTSKGYRPDSSGRIPQSPQMKPERFYVYILQSRKDFSFYVGQCDDLDHRVSKHGEGMSKYTLSKRPLRLVYFESYDSRSKAIIREKEIKKMKSRIYIEQLISNGKKNYCAMVEEVPTSREKVCIPQKGIVPIHRDESLSLRK